MSQHPDVDLFSLDLDLSAGLDDDQVNKMLQRKKEEVAGKVNSTKGQAEVLIEILTELEILEKKFAEEKDARVQLERLVETEIADLNQRLLLEAEARQGVQSSIINAVKVKQGMISELDLLATKLRHMVDLLAPRDSGKDVDLLALTEEIESGLAEMNDLLDLEVKSSENSKGLRDIIDKLSMEAKARHTLKQQNDHLLEAVKQLEVKLQEEHAVGDQLRTMLDKEAQERDAIQQKLTADINSLKKG